nr:MAG: hypothetical protein DIU78_26735 [Pseudomonadota bacterium]
MGTMGGGGFGGDGGSEGGTAGSETGGTGGDALEPSEPGITDGTPVEEALPDLPSTRQEHSVVALRGEVYVIAGFAGGSVTDSIDAYDPVSKTWRHVGEVPEPAQHLNAAVVNDKLYIAGYYYGSSFSQTRPNVYEYDPDTGDWTRKRDMPMGTDRASACVAVLDGKIYLFAGARGNTVADSSYYDVAADEWHELPPLPEPREHCAAAAIDGKLYVAAGRIDSITGVRPATYEFDPATNQYTQKAPIPTPRGGVAAGVIDGKLFVIGGEGNPEHPQGVFPQIEAYDPKTDSWESYPPMDVPRHGFGAAVIDDRIYLPGGANRQGGGATAEHSVFFFEP